MSNPSCLLEEHLSDSLTLLSPFPQFLFLVPSPRLFLVGYSSLIVLSRFSPFYSSLVQRGAFS